MANAVYTLNAHAPEQPETLVVMNSFFGAKPAMAVAPMAAGDGLAAGEYKEVDMATEAAAVMVALAEPATTGDRAALKVTSLAPMGVTVTATGLSRMLMDSDSIVVFEYNGTAWVEA